MKPKSLSEMALADATVVDVLFHNGDLDILIRDWREHEIRLRFRGVLAFESFSIEGAEISHGTESTDDAFIARGCELAGDDPTGYRCFALFGARDDEARMRIVARELQSD